MQFIGENMSSFKENVKLFEVAHKIQGKASCYNVVRRVVTKSSYWLRFQDPLSLAFQLWADCIHLPISKVSQDEVHLEVFMRFDSFIGRRIVGRKISSEKHTFKMPLLLSLAGWERKSASVSADPFWRGLLSQAYGGP